MIWINIKDKIPRYESSVILWIPGLRSAVESFFTEGFWILEKNNPNYEVTYWHLEDISHWMYWPDKPRVLWTDWEKHEHEIDEWIRNGRIGDCPTIKELNGRKKDSSC